MYKTFICLRYLAKKRITWFSVVSVLLGVMTLVVVMSVMHGFTGFLRQAMQGIVADISVETCSPLGFSDYERLMKDIETVPGVVATAPRITKYGIMQRPMGGEFISQTVKIIGIDPEREDKVNDFKAMVGKPLDVSGNVPSHDDGTPQTGDDDADLVGRNWQLQWDDPDSVDPRVRDKALFIVGSQLLPRTLPRTFFVGWMIAKLITIDMIEGEPSARHFALANTFSSGKYDYDSSTVYITLDAAQKLTRMDAAVSEIGVKANVATQKELETLASEIQKKVDEADYIPLNRRPEALCWFEINRTVLQAIELETTMMYILLFLLLIVAGFATIAILTLIVMQKRKDVGILMSMGASQTGIRGVFLTFGLVIGIVGASLGVAAGLAFLWRLEDIRHLVFRMTEFDPFPASLYYFSEIPTEYSFWRILKIWGAAIGVCLLASLYPAMRASRLDPVEIIRYE